MRPYASFLFAVLAIVLAAGGAAAFPFPGKQPGGKGHNPHAAQAAELHSIKLMLERADHDYKGHRAAAVRDIAAAIRELDPEHEGRGGGKVPGGHEPQAVSDAQLREALKQLEAMHGHLGKKKGGHHKAAAHLERAINELKTALQVK
jgi:hypothetical protein